MTRTSDYLGMMDWVGPVLVAVRVQGREVVVVDMFSLGFIHLPVQAKSFGAPSNESVTWAQRFHYIQGGQELSEGVAGFDFPVLFALPHLHYRSTIVLEVTGLGNGGFIQLLEGSIGMGSGILVTICEAGGITVPQKSVELVHSSRGRIVFVDQITLRWSGDS